MPAKCMDNGRSQKESGDRKGHGIASNWEQRAYEPAKQSKRPGIRPEDVHLHRLPPAGSVFHNQETAKAYRAVPENKTNELRADVTRYKHRSLPTFQSGKGFDLSARPMFDPS